LGVFVDLSRLGLAAFRYGGKIDVAKLGSQIRSEIQKLLGDSITVEKHQNANLDAWKSHDMLSVTFPFRAPLSISNVPTARLVSRSSFRVAPPLSRLVLQPT
tara:strand:- start:43 stop:348 length:306 start_codon:yes stop_codon:yes gene_type:complete